MAHSVTRLELFEQLRDQLGFLERSTRAFDEGDESEAKRLATTIRILVHDTSASHSLLGQLGLKERLRWVDTGERINPGNLMPTNGLVIIKVESSPGGGAEVQYVPPLGKLTLGRERRPVAFAKWWETDLVKDGRGNLFSRRGLISAVANKDGGAHVDPRLSDDYVALSRLNSLGAQRLENAGRAGVSFGGRGVPARGNPALAAVRQVAFEVERTLVQIRWLVEDVERHIGGGPRDRIDRNTDCACGSGDVAGECCLAHPKKAFELGNLYSARGDVDLAIDAWQRSTDLGDARAPLNLALALTEDDDFERAEAVFRIGAERGDAAAASNLGCLLLDRDATTEAMEAWERGAELGSPAAINNLARLLLDCGEHARARRLFLSGADSGDADSAFFAGNLEREAGNTSEALRFYGQARNGGHAEGCFNYGRLLMEANRLDEAKDVMREAATSADPRVSDAAKMALQKLEGEPD